MAETNMSRVWFWAPQWYWFGWETLLPVYVGGDEYGRRTVLLALQERDPATALGRGADVGQRPHERLRVRAGPRLRHHHPKGDPMSRPHPRCWTGDRYEHHCHQPSGRYCIETGCYRQAGTPWGPYWCAEHDVERLDRVSAGLAGIAASLGATTPREDAR